MKAVGVWPLVLASLAVSVLLANAQAPDFGKTLSAAQNGDVHAQSVLGYMYLAGEGVTKDGAAALKWLRKAAEQGDLDSQCNLGAIFASGQGVPRDYVEAGHWFRKAAERGHAGAQCNL